MKKFLLIFIPIVIALVLFGFLLVRFAEITCLFYSFGEEQDGFLFGVNKTAHCSFVAKYTCTEYIENMEITIPDEYDGLPVTRLGGFVGSGYPCPFMLDISEIVEQPSDTRYYRIFSGDIYAHEFPEEVDVVDLPFVLNIGKNIKAIVNVEFGFYYAHRNEDGSVTYYHPVVYINCSEDNEHFYSKDGKLYDKKTDELITEFEYAA